MTGFLVRSITTFFFCNRVFQLNYCANSRIHFNVWCQQVLLLYESHSQTTMVCFCVPTNHAPNTHPANRRTCVPRDCLPKRLCPLVTLVVSICLRPNWHVFWYFKVFNVNTSLVHCDTKGFPKFVGQSSCKQVLSHRATCSSDYLRLTTPHMVLKDSTMTSLLRFINC